MNTNQIIHHSHSAVLETGHVSKPAANAHTDGSQAAAAAPSNVAADQASLSSASKLLVEALRTPDVRTEKVASLQAAIADGTYHVSASDVAGKLLESLLGR